VFIPLSLLPLVLKKGNSHTLFGRVAFLSRPFDNKRDLGHRKGDDLE
jgi:hypothetical protein